MGKTLYILYLFSTIFAIVISCVLFFRQEEKKGKILALILFLFAGLSTYKSIYDHKTNRPKPYVIIEGIYTASDEKSLIEIVVKMQNTGNTKAQNVSIKSTVNLNDDILYEKLSKKICLEPGKVIAMEAIRFKGEIVKEIFEKKNKFTMEILVSYSDEYGGDYDSVYLRMFSPMVFDSQYGFGSSWIIIRS